MLKILDKYILKRYLGAFFFIILLSSMLTIVIDSAEKVDNFLDEGGPTFYQVFEYYLNFIPYINGLIFPLYNLIAVIFFTSRLAANSEFIAMISNGVNHYRLLVPYFLGACIIGGIHYYGNHYIIPISNKTRTYFENTYVYKYNFVGTAGNFHVAANPQEEFYLQGFNRYDSSGSQFAWIKHDTTKMKRTSVWTAHAIRLLTPPNRWRLTGIRKRENINDYSARITQLPPQMFMDTTLALLVSDLVVRDNDKDNKTTSELIQYIDKQKQKGMNAMVYEVERYRRSSDPFSIFILTIIGFSIASRKMRGGMAWHLVIGIGTSALFLFMTKFSMTFSINGGLPPLIGVWTPNIIFTVVALWMLFRAQK